MQSKQAAASRTSPTLRGNWVCETLLGEKLPLPPADVPKLPEEGGENGLSVRQLTEKHSKDPACAVCHVRMDPYGFALESFDSIGRRRAKDALGLAVETKAKLRDGTEFEGIDGLRDYLATKKKGVVVRLFCKKLLGYALGALGRPVGHGPHRRDGGRTREGRRQGVGRRGDDRQEQTIPHRPRRG